MRAKWYVIDWHPFVASIKTDFRNGIHVKHFPKWIFNYKYFLTIAFINQWYVLLWRNNLITCFYVASECIYVFSLHSLIIILYPFLIQFLCLMLYLLLINEHIYFFFTFDSVLASLPLFYPWDWKLTSKCNFQHI